ncbi:AraC family transcriptional regulator [Variovorax sp. J22R133]|uniref:AraC family transcriptional regulator n=1 Tax=Variovorax brevis TaxID=3053503 RepID=UPI002575D885|nr:AraC family transcriptional regulator [Variovorax sp. J22R133]MDM0111848.1 AraC family transcriptional regulator [Variovorax sp. J22R133]
MSHPPVSVPIMFVRGLLTGVYGRGLDPTPFLEEAGILSELVGHDGARVTGEQYIALFRVVAQRLQDDGLGFFSRPLHTGSAMLVMRSAIGAPTLEVAMRRVARTFQLLQDDVVLDSIREGSLAGWALDFRSGPHPNFLHEMLLRVLWRLLAWLVAVRLPAERFDLAFETPTYAGDYGAVLPAELRFGQLRSAFWIDAHALHRPVRRDEPALRAYLADFANNVILPRRDDNVGTRVRLSLRSANPAWPDLATIADALHMSPSTLQRHLAAEGTTFQLLKDELRRDIAISRLNTSTVSLAALAGELGFSDSAAFQRAFKSWTGSPPGAYRRGAV